MSQSLKQTGASDVTPGGLTAPAGGSAPSADEIAEEINDHLSCRQAELEREGVEGSEAEERARWSFGDAHKIARKMFWIHHGERIMSQRLLWAAIGLVLVALIANLYLQQRSAAAMNAAIAKLTEQMERGQPMAEARIRVVDENGKPRAGLTVSVHGAKPSPYLSNATYARDFESDGEGLIRTGPIVLGDYHLKASSGGSGWSAWMEGGFRLQDNREVVDVTLTAPQPTLTPVTFELAEMSGGWKPQGCLSLYSSTRFDRTDVRASGSVEFGKAGQAPLLAGADLELSYNLERKNPDGNQQCFEAGEKLSRDDPGLVSGGTIRLGLPKGRLHRLTAEGEQVPNRVASGPRE